MSGAVALVLSILAALLTGTGAAGAASAAWPATWTPYSFVNGDPILDVGGDNNPSHSDIWSGAPTGLGTVPTVYFAADGTNIFFRLRVAADPEVNRGGSFNSGVWLVQVAVDGVHEASLGLNGKPAGVNDEVYVSDAAGTVLNTVYGPVVPDGGASAGGRVVSDGAGGYFVDFQVPVSAITAVAPAVTPSAPVQLFFGTSQNTNNINKDWMIGSSVSFVGLGVVALDGTVVVDDSTEVAILSAPVTNDSTPTISGSGEAGATVVVDLGGQSLSTTVAGDGTWSVTAPTALADGTSPVSVTATDAVGNTATATQNLTVDTSTSVAITSPTAAANSLPTISGSGEAGATVVVDVGGQSLSTTVAGDGTWSVTVPVALADGTHPVTVTATDAAGNTATATQDLTVDTSTALGITSPALTNDSTPTISGPGEAGAAIVVLVDGQSLSTTVAGDGTWSVAVPVALADATHPVTVTATDAAGNDATTTQNLTVDTVTAASITSPSTSDNATPTISGTGEPGAAVELVVDGQTLPGTVDGSGGWSIAVPVGLPDGTHTVTATLTDLVGNTAIATQDLTVDTSTALAVTSTPFTNDPTPVISGTGEAGATVVVDVDGQSLSTTVAGDGTWAVTVPVALTDATHPVSVTATDLSGNTATASQELTVDATTSVSITPPAPTDDPTPVITGTGEPAATIELAVAGQILTGTVDNLGNWSVTIPVALSDAVHTISVTATDLAGNTDTDTQPITVDTQTSVGITSPPLTTDATPVVSGTGEAGATIAVDVGGQSLSTTVAGDGTWSITVPVALADANHTLTATATDGLGNVATTMQSLTVDGSTTVAITSPALATDSTPNIFGTGEPGASLVVTIGGQTLTATVAGDETWSVSVPVALVDAIYPVAVTATDLAGNTATTSQNLTIDATTFVTVTSPSLSANPTPVITGTAEPGANIEVVVGTETINTTADLSGNWAAVTTVVLADGSYLVPITATVIDGSGNSATTTQNLTIDTSTSAAITSTAATTDPTPTIVGTGEPGSTVTVLVGGQTLTGTVDGEGSWSVPVLVALADGSHSVTATLTDLAGNTTVATQDLIVDTSTFVAVTSAPFTNDSTPTIGGTGEPGSTVTVTVDGQTLSTPVAGDGSWSVDVPATLADGTHPVSVSALDGLGNTASTTQNLTIDTVTSAAITSAAATDNPTPTIVGTGEPGSTVTVLVGGQTLTGTVDGEGSWSVPVLVALADGSHSVTATLTDLAGNTAVATQDLVVDTSTFVAVTSAPFTNDSTPTIGGTGEPGSTVTVTVDGQTLSTPVAGDGSWSVDVPATLADGTHPVSVSALDGLGNTASTTQNLTIDTVTSAAITSAAATDNPTPTIVGTGEPGSTVTVLVGGQTLTGTVDGEGSWSVPVLVALADGSHSVTATLTDLAGNTTVATQDLVVDTSTFVAVTSAPFTNDSTPTIGGTGEPGSTVTVTVDGQTLSTPVAGDGTWSVTVATALADGVYAVEVVIVDPAGNTASSTQSLTVDTAVTVVVTSPVSGNDSTPTIGGTGEPGSTVTVTVDEQTLSTTVAGDGTWSVTVATALADGVYAVEVVIVDPLGNTASSTQSLTVDTAVTVVVTSPVSGNDSTPTIGGTGEPGSTVTVTVDEQTLSTTVAGDGTWSVTVATALADGVYAVEVVIVDPLGNTASSTQSLTVDTAVTVVVTSPVSGNDSTPTIGGTGEPGSTVTVTVDGQTLSTTVAGDGTWSVTVATALADGVYAVEVVIVDPAGNIEVLSLTVEVDSTQETADDTQPADALAVTGSDVRGLLLLALLLAAVGAVLTVGTRRPLRDLR